MKKLIFTALIFVSLSAIAQTKSAAQANQVRGMYIFFESHPVAEYAVLGTVKKTGLVMTGKPTEMYETILRRAQRDFPECDGIIFEGIDMRHATCIKFK
jgi:hypothetical protein